MKKRNPNIRETLRSRNFAFIIYPESAPKNWLHKLNSICVPSFVSPCHSADDDHCKSHYHCVLHFDNLKSVGQIEELLRWSFGSIPMSDGLHFAVNHCEIVNNFSSYIRYLIHFDNPEKEQFCDCDDFEKPWDKIICFHYDRTKLDTFFQLGGVNAELFDIIQFIKEYECRFFSSLVDYAMACQQNWIPVIIENRSLILSYIKSFGYLKDSVAKSISCDSAISVNVDDTTILF